MTTQAQPQIPAALISADRERRYIRWSLTPGVKSPTYAHLRADGALRSTDFHAIGHQVVWEAVEAEMASSGRLYLSDVEKAILANPRGGKGGVSLLRDLCREIVVVGASPEIPADVAELTDLAVELRALAGKRQRLRAWQHGAQAASEDNPDGAERALQMLSETALSAFPVEYLETDENIGRAYLSHVTARHDTTKLHRPGFELLDYAIGDLKRQTLWVIGGTSGSGKSSFALSIAMRMAKAGIRGGWISFEDPVSVVGDRLVAMELNISLPNDRDISEFEHRRIGQYVMDQTGKKLLRFAYPLNLGVPELMTAIRLLNEQGAEFVVIDYLQAIRQPAGVDRRNFIRDVVAQVKAELAARNMNGILLSQLARPKDDPFAEPFNTRLKESGDIEDKAEIITLLWKNGDDDDAKAFAKVTKVKWSARRPRGELIRDHLGTVTDFRKVDKPAPIPGEAPPRRRLPRQDFDS